MSFLIASWFAKISGVPERFCSQETWQKFHWVGNTKHSWSTPCVFLNNSQSKWINFSVDKKWIHWLLWCPCQPLREFVWFDQVRKTKAWTYKPLVSSVLYFASTQGNMHPMMEDVVLGNKFPHAMLLEFSWLIALHRAWGVFILTSRNTSSPRKCNFQIGSCIKQERNVTLKRWGWKLQEMSHLQIRRTCL
jgi:hypothetical protein